MSKQPSQLWPLHPVYPIFWNGPCSLWGAYWQIWVARRIGVSFTVCLKQHSDFLAPLAVPQDLVDRCQQSVREHCTFSHRLSELQQWITMVTQTLESHQGDVRPWDAESQEAGPEVRCRFILSPAVPYSLLDALHTEVQRLPQTSTSYACGSIHVSHRGYWLKFQRKRSSCPCSKHWASL